MSLIKTRSLAFCLIMTMGASSFAEHETTKHVSQQDRSDMMMKLVALAAVNIGVNRGGQVAGMSTTTKGVTHTASIFYTLGLISSNPVFYDLGMRTLIGGAAATFSNFGVVADLTSKLPLGIGAALKDAGPLGTTLVAITSYETFATMYQNLWDSGSVKKWLSWN